MKFLIMIMFVLTSINVFAKNTCSEGDFHGKSYKIEDESMDNYGKFRSVLTLDGFEIFSGNGQYFVSEDGSMAYLEVKYKNKTTKEVAVLTMDGQQDGNLYTLCIGKDLKKNYSCISCLESFENE
jgi:hypothetical protein